VLCFLFILMTCPDILYKTCMKGFITIYIEGSLIGIKHEDSTL